MVGDSERAIEILGELAAGGPATSWPTRLTTSCRSLMAMDGAGLAVMDAAGLGGLIAATDGLAVTMEDLQFSSGEGPCRTSVQQSRPVRVLEFGTAEARRWPQFVPAAVASGARAAFAFPLRSGTLAIGVLNLYRRDPGELTDEQLTEALSQADAATAVLLHLRYAQVPTEGQREEPAVELTDVLDDRAQPAAARSQQLQVDVVVVGRLRLAQLVQR